MFLQHDRFDRILALVLPVLRCHLRLRLLILDGDTANRSTAVTDTERV
jgi:hypothetical protein